MAVKRGGYAREIAGEFGAYVRRFPRWGGRYVWWMQAAEVLVAGAACSLVWWFAAVTPGRPAGAALAAFAGIAVVAALAELEARVTERRQERRRLAERFGLDLDAPGAVRDGYVLAYELGGPLGVALIGEAFLTVAAVPAIRWDLTDVLWRFTVRESLLGGVVVQLPGGSLAALDELRGLFRQVGAGRLDTLVAVERHLAALGARDVTVTVADVVEEQ